MNIISAIHKIVDDNFEDEMDSWYEGSTDKVKELALGLEDDQWSKLIESVSAEKPDMWKVFLAHCFIDDQPYIGKSQELLITLSLKCKGAWEANMIIQYMDNFNWTSIDDKLRNSLYAKVEELRNIEPPLSVGYTFRDIMRAIKQQSLK